MKIYFFNLFIYFKLVHIPNSWLFILLKYKSWMINRVFLTQGICEVQMTTNRARNQSHDLPGIENGVHMHMNPSKTRPRKWKHQFYSQNLTGRDNKKQQTFGNHKACFSSVMITNGLILNPAYCHNTKYFQFTTPNVALPFICRVKQGHFDIHGLF